MKKLMLFFGIAASALFSSCSKNEAASNNASLLLLEVDYISYTFLGGKEYSYSSATNTDTVPVYAGETPPCDFHNLVVEYVPTGDVIFEGKLRRKPSTDNPIITPEYFGKPTTFERITNTLPAPNNTQYQVIYIDSDFYPSTYNPIWNAVSDLQLVSDYYKVNKKIGIFLYTPVIGFPGENHHNAWRWFIVMHK